MERGLAGSWVGCWPKKVNQMCKVQCEVKKSAAIPQITVIHRHGAVGLELKHQQTYTPQWRPINMVETCQEEYEERNSTEEELW